MSRSIQNSEEIFKEYPLARELQELIPNLKLETVSINGEKKLKAILTNYSSYNSTPKIADRDDLREFLGQIQTAEVVGYFHNEFGVKNELEDISELLPNLREIDLIRNNTITNDGKPVILPERFFSASLPDHCSATYPEGTIQTAISSTLVMQSKEAVESLSNFGIQTEFKFNPENFDDLIHIDLSQENLSQLTNLASPSSLQQIAFLASTRSLSFSSTFSENKEFEEQISKLTKMFPNLEHLEIKKQYKSQGDNRITEDFDFSQLERFPKLSSLKLPITAIGDFRFLNELADLSEIIMSPSLGGYDAQRSLAGVDKLISQIFDAKAEQITKLHLYHCPLNQETFNKLCGQFSGLEDLSLSTIQIEDGYENSKIYKRLVEKFESLTQLPNLQSLSINDLVLEGVVLEKLTNLRLFDPSNRTLQCFGKTSVCISNLKKLTVTSSSDCEKSRSELGSNNWQYFLEGLSNLQELTDLHAQKSRDIGKVEINQETIGHLAKTSLKKLVITGFTSSDDLSERTSGFNFSTKVLNLIEQKRDDLNKTREAASLTTTVEIRSGSSLVSSHQKTKG